MSRHLARPHGIALIGAKRYYFGTGGSIAGFRDELAKRKKAEAAKLRLKNALMRAKLQAAKEAEKKEWNNLRSKQVWDPETVREFNEVAQAARRDVRRIALPPTEPERRPPPEATRAGRAAAPMNAGP